ncbi:hypothetical protein Trisim1_005029 [Trichoderma cf. simile WF8]
MAAQALILHYTARPSRGSRISLPTRGFTHPKPYRPHSHLHTHTSLRTLFSSRPLSSVQQPLPLSLASVFRCPFSTFFSPLVSVSPA